MAGDLLVANGGERGGRQAGGQRHRQRLAGDHQVSEEPVGRGITLVVGQGPQLIAARRPACTRKSMRWPGAIRTAVGSSLTWAAGEDFRLVHPGQRDSVARDGVQFVVLKRQEDVVLIAGVERGASAAPRPAAWRWSAPAGR